MRYLTFQNGRGESVTLGGADRYGIVLFEDPLPMLPQTQKAPYQDGTTYLDTTMGERDITVQGLLLNRYTLDADRRYLQRVLNPKLGTFLLTYDKDGVSRQITVVFENAPVFPDKGRQPLQPFVLNLLAPDPAWVDPAQQSWTLSSFVGGFSFPFSFPLSFGEVGDFRTVDNMGDLDTPVFITFDGPLANPVLQNLTTGQEIRITQTIPAGERLEINTAYGKKSVMRVDANGNRTNAFHYVSPSSSFWKLIPGENLISYSATEEAGSSAVNIYYNYRYVGV